MKRSYLVCVVLIATGIALLAIAGFFLLKTSSICITNKYIKELKPGNSVFQVITLSRVSNVTIYLEASCKAYVYVVKGYVNSSELGKELMTRKLLGSLTLTPKAVTYLRLTNLSKGSYTLIASSNTSKTYLLGAKIVTCSLGTTEMYNSVTSVTGIVAILAGIITLIRELMRGREGLVSELVLGNVGKCFTRSMNRHRCVLYALDDEERTYRKVLEILTNKLGYKVWRKVADNIYLLKSVKGRTRFLSKKPRTLVLSLIGSEITIDYEVSMWLASGPLDLPEVFNEFRELIKELGIKE